MFSAEVVARFNQRVDRLTQSPCWLWTGATTGAGYGHLGIEGRHITAHRFAYEIANGPVPDGLVIDHLCRVRTCVRPDHLEAVSQRENILRGMSPAARQARQATCIRGHSLSGENLKIHNGHRRCLKCILIRSRRRYDSEFTLTN